MAVLFFRNHEENRTSKFSWTHTHHCYHINDRLWTIYHIYPVIIELCLSFVSISELIPYVIWPMAISISLDSLSNTNWTKKGYEKLFHTVIHTRTHITYNSTTVFSWKRWKQNSQSNTIHFSIQSETNTHILKSYRQQYDMMFTNESDSQRTKEPRERQKKTLRWLFALCRLSSFFCSGFCFFFYYYSRILWSGCLWNWHDNCYNIRPQISNDIVK